MSGEEAVGSWLSPTTKKSWEAMRTDPEFQIVMKAELAEKTLDKADVILMRPTDFSLLRQLGKLIQKESQPTSTTSTWQWT